MHKQQFLLRKLQSSHCKCFVLCTQASVQERERMRQLNSALNDLKQCLPSTMKNSCNGESKKLTKIRTLKLAVNYIELLTDLLNRSEYKEGHKVETE